MYKVDHTNAVEDKQVHYERGVLPVITDLNNTVPLEINDNKIISTQKCRFNCKTSPIDSLGCIPEALESTPAQQTIRGSATNTQILFEMRKK